MFNTRSMTRLSVFLCLAGGALLASAADAGRVTFVAGPAFAVAAGGAERPLVRGGEIASGETIRTGQEGRVQLQFTDGAQMSLKPNTEFRIDSYVFNGRNDGQEKGLFNLLKGGLRTITGLVGKQGRDAYRLTTNVATIGIRGTEYSAEYDPKDSEKLSVHTSQGLVEVCNSQGCTLVAVGETAFVGGRNQLPVRVTPGAGGTTGGNNFPTPPMGGNELPPQAVGGTRNSSGGLPTGIATGCYFEPGGC